MDRHRRLVLVATLALALLPAAPAVANAGVPMIQWLFPGSWLLLVPVILIEAMFAMRILGQTAGAALNLSAAANLASTALGIPITWYVLARVEMATGADTWGVLSRWRDLGDITIRSAWFGPQSPADLRWKVPAACATLCLPFFLVSVLIEAGVARVMLGGASSSRVWRWAWLANAGSYGLILALLMACALINAYRWEYPDPKAGPSGVKQSRRHWHGVSPVVGLAQEEDTMTTLNLSLPDDMKAFVEAQTAQEGFSSTGEYLVSLIREAQKRQAKRALEAKFREALESGPATDMTEEDWDSIEREALERWAREQSSP